MDETPSSENNIAKKEKMMRTLSVIWIILIGVFALVILMRLYVWSRGEGGLHQILSPLGMIFVGLANIFGDRNKSLQRVLIAFALILVVSGLITLFVY